MANRNKRAAANKRVTVYMTPEYHRALRVKSAETEYSVSDLVNAAVRTALLEDAADLEAFDKRAGEPALAFEDVVKSLKRDGKI
jgi:Arc/MetJ-type ribon-helix-helix transcriptional regulator